MGVLMKFEIFFILLNFCSITPGQEYDAQVLDLFEGDICQRGLLGRSSDYICRPLKQCPGVRQLIKRNIIPRLCSLANMIVPFVPICLNEDQSFTPTTSIATGWGQVGHGGPQSSELLKVCLNKTSLEECNTVYATSVDLPYGVLSDSQICAGFIPGGKDTCGGDSGGPLQVPNSIRAFMYTQVGITSTGKPCGEADTPGIYTRVSKYVSWIEQSVWPKNCTDCLDINIV